ncbi:MAG: hypothetical protein RI897_3511 [Verrucomicrobiota bacterium]
MIGEAGDEVPGAVAAHTEAGEVDAVGVDGEVLFQLVKETEEEAGGLAGFGGLAAVGFGPGHVGPLLIFGALWGEDIARELFAVGGFEVEAGAVDELFLVVGASFAGAMEEEDERVCLVGLGVRGAEQAVGQAASVG